MFPRSLLPSFRRLSEQQKERKGRATPKGKKSQQIYVESQVTNPRRYLGILLLREDGVGFVDRLEHTLGDQARLWA